jgi:hypothetical protein
VKRGEVLTPTYDGGASPLLWSTRSASFGLVFVLSNDASNSLLPVSFNANKVNAARAVFCSLGASLRVAAYWATGNTCPNRCVRR